MSQTIIVFREDCILAAEGREGKNPVLARVKRIELQGFGDSFDRWRKRLAVLKEEWNPEQVRLVLPAGMCVTRILQIPQGRKRQLAEMAVREVRDSFKNEIADYSILHQEKKGSVDKANLEQFAEMFQECGIQIRGITVPMEGYLRVLKRLESYWNRTAIYLFFEEGSMTSVLCQNGRYLYSSRSRIFSEPGTLDFGTEIVRSISGILQFYAAGKQEIPITVVYYAGCPDGDFEVSVEGIRNLQLDVFPMEAGRETAVPSGEEAAEWLACIGALIQDGKRERRIDLARVGMAAECAQCNNTGYRGRIAIHEILAVDVPLRRMISNHASVEELVSYGREHQNMRTLRESGLKLVKEGITTPEELMKIAYE